MTTAPGDGVVSSLPLAMAALDVAGHMRERSPTDMAIFGPESGHLVERFVDGAAGQALLARVVNDGAAEDRAWLLTAAGHQHFRISLWRQRGGERIRILAAFAIDDRASDARPTNPALVRLSHDMRSPLVAAMGFAELIRAEGQGKGNGMDRISGHAASIIAAAWRLASIADDLDGALKAGDAVPMMRLGEIDLARLVRRVARLAEPAACTAGAEVDLRGLDGVAAQVSVLADESMLWSVVDNLIQNALRHAALVSVTCRRDREGLVLEVLDNGRGLPADALAAAMADMSTGRGFGFCRQLARVNGADLEIESTPGQGTVARLRFPASRVLDLP